MPGMVGFTHKCKSEKCDITRYKKTINESIFTDVEIKHIWEFYVTKSIAEQSSQSISLENYGWESTTNQETGFPALEALLIEAANISALCCIRAKSIKDTLAAMDLLGDRICIEHPRAVLKQDFNYDVNENEKFSFEFKESRIKCLFRHIRNAFAHGNTYFFDNGNMLLEDKEGNGDRKITAKILIPQSALISWISIVDKDRILPYRNEE